MLKKNEVLAILERGGSIHVDTISRSARVVDVNGEWLDCCRYDVAERIEHSDGYRRRKTDWFATYYIEIDPPAEEAREDMTAEEIEENVARIVRGVIGKEKAAKMMASTEHRPSGILVFLCHGGCCLGDAITIQEQIEEAGYFIPETYQEHTDRKNRERCRRIAEEVELYALRSSYKCPECGSVHDLDDFENAADQDDECTTQYKCPECGDCSEEYSLSAVDLYDYFEDCLDIEYRCDGRREYRSVCVMVACGGPNIYIDTETKAVELYWWGDRASYPLDPDTVDAVDAWASEYWEAI